MAHHRTRGLPGGWRPVIGHFMGIAQTFQNGDENARVDLSCGGELGRLGKTLNIMFDTIVREKRMADEARVELGKALHKYEATIASLQEVNQHLNAEIAKHRGAEDSLAVERERLAATLSSISEGVIACDRRGTVSLMNNVAEKMTGWSLAEARGRETEEIFHLAGQESTPLPADPLQRAMSEDYAEPLPEGVHLLGRNGICLPVSGNCVPLHDGTGRLSGGIFIFHDIAAEEAVRRQMSKIDKLESLGVLAGGLAHDFNNILTCILGNASMAQAHTDADGMPMLRDVGNAVQRAKQLTKQLLTFAKGNELVRQSAQIEEVIRETCHFTLAGSPIRVHFDISADINWVYMDSGQISQVIQNIVLNAAQAMPKGGEIVISCANCRIEGENTMPSLPLAPGDYVRVCFVDNGPGIESQYLDRLFDPYFTTKETGDGLGLAICHSIISKHNGHINVVSPVASGKGAMFTFWLPASRKELPAAVERVDIQPATEVILVVDDDEIIREVIGKMLDSAGYTVLFAEEGRKALALYSERLTQGKPVDCVILDLTIPGGMGGKSIMEALRRIDPQAKGIISSGYVNDPMVVAYADYGFAGAIGKPFSASELLSVVRRVLSKSGDDGQGHGNTAGRKKENRAKKGDIPRG